MMWRKIIVHFHGTKSKQIPLSYHLSFISLYSWHIEQLLREIIAQCPVSCITTVLKKKKKDKLVNRKPASDLSLFLCWIYVLFARFWELLLVLVEKVILANYTLKSRQGNIKGNNQSNPCKQSSSVQSLN